MLPATEVVHGLVQEITPGDAVETEHRADTLRWLEDTDDIFRRVKPATPGRHLVSYVAITDPSDGSSLLVDHIKAGLWLPPGGHVEPGEHPAETARRETREELAVEPVFVEVPARPMFVTVTRTVGAHRGHLDVSLWFVLTGQGDMPLRIDRTEFTEARWWTPAEVLAADPAGFDPHYKRFMAKVRR
ncbi:MAG: NUDIX hydrolase [Nocardioidaceae bacterium]